MTSHAIELLWIKHPIFAAAGERRCVELAARYPAQEVEDGEVLARAGERAAELFVLLEGTVRLFHSQADGRQATVKLLRAPNTAGTLELIHDIPRLISIAAVQRATIVRFPREDYLAFIRESPEICFEQVKHIAAAFLVAARNEQVVFTSLPARVAGLLLAYGRYFGVDDERGGLRIDQPLSQQDIANGVGSVRRSVAGLMAKWREEGVLTKRRRKLVLLDLPFLEDAAAAIDGSLCYQMGMPLDELYHEQELPTASLEVTRGQGSMVGRGVAIEGELVLGSRPPAHFLIADEQASAQHCRVFRARTGGRYWVEDLGSENGLQLDGEPVRRAVLKHGDTIRIGATELRFTVKREAADPP